MPANGRMAATDRLLTIVLPDDISGNAACTHRNVPVRLVSIAFFQSSSGRVSTGARACATPALLIRTLSDAYWSRTCANNFLTDAGSVTSQYIPVISALTVAATTAFRVDSSRPV